VSATCLVADDHPALRTAIESYLDEAGYDVVAAVPDGPRAVSAAAELHPETAVVDLRMPRLDGVALVEALRDASPETRIVVYTAEIDGSTAEAVLTAGAAGVVLKEAPLADLGRALEAALAGGSYLDSAVTRPGHTVNLTVREREVLALLAEGLPHEEIAGRLGIGAETVRTHLKKASERLGAATRTQAVATALRLGLIE